MKKHFEILVLKIALWAIDRNVQRCTWISRRDNNYLFEVKYRLKKIIKNMQTDYNSPEY